MQLSEAIDALVTTTQAEGCSAYTVEGYRRNLGHLVEFLGDVEVSAISVQDLRRYSAALRVRSERYSDHPMSAAKEGGLSPFTIATYLRAAKRLFNWLFEEGMISDNPSLRLKNPTPTRREPKAVSREDFARILAVTDGDAPEQVRNRALILFLADTGCRAAGVTHLRLSDIDLDAMAARLTEKGLKTRVVPFSPITRDALIAWLTVRPDDGSEDWLFINLGRKRKEMRLTEEALGEVLRRLGKRAGVAGVVNPHSWRHAFAREWLRNRGDLATLARILGHTDVSVTARYYAVFTDYELAEFHARHSPVAVMSRTQASTSTTEAPPAS